MRTVTSRRKSSVYAFLWRTRKHLLGIMCLSISTWMLVPGRAILESTRRLLRNHFQQIVVAFNALEVMFRLGWVCSVLALSARHQLTLTLAVSKRSAVKSTRRGAMMSKIFSTILRSGSSLLVGKGVNVRAWLENVSKASTSVTKNSPSKSQMTRR